MKQTTQRPFAMGRIAGCLGLACLMLLAPALACSSTNRVFDDDQRTFEPDAGDAEAAAPTCGGRRCSRDLHAVVDDCTEEILEECPADQGCAASACVPACESASASQGSIGCSFYAIPPDVPVENETSCWAAFVANTWTKPVTVKAEHGGEPLDISRSIYRAIVEGEEITYERIEGPLPAGELGIVFLAQGEAGPNNRKHLDCPKGVEVAWRGTAVKEHQSSIYPAFRLTTDMPVSAFSLFPYGGAESHVPAGTLLLPTSSWTTNYMLGDGWNANAGSPFVQIVAQEDGTEVRLRPQVDIRDGVGVSGAIRGSVARWTLQRGQVLELMQRESLAGSPIETSHPVAVFGGNQCAFVDDEDFACDSLHQQIASVRQWSSSYSAVPYRSRRQGLEGATPAPESVLWRIVAAADGTELEYDPAPPPGAPAKMKSGEVAKFSSDRPFRVRSQDPSHPFFLAVYMTGADRYRTLGDPDFVTIVPDAQFLDRYVFFLDHTYSDSNLTVVRRKGPSGFRDVTLDCLGPVTGWQPLGTDGTTEYAWVEITRGRAPVSTPIGSCSYGRHEASSDGAFALYVWGIDSYASYGFPAGAGSRPTSPYSIEVR